MGLSVEGENEMHNCSALFFFPFWQQILAADKEEIQRIAGSSEYQRFEFDCGLRVLRMVRKCLLVLFSPQGLSDP